MLVKFAKVKDLKVFGIAWKSGFSWSYECDCIFKDSQDLSNPTIRLSLSAIEDLNIRTQMVSDINYIYIDEVKRYYFVTGRVIYRADVIDLTLHVDVMGTYFTKLYQSQEPLMIQRNEMYGDVWQEDNNVIFNTIKKDYVEYPSAQTLNKFYGSALTSNVRGDSYNVVVQSIGGENQNPMSNSYWLQDVSADSGLPELTENITGDGKSYSYYVITNNMLRKLIYEAFLDVNLANKLSSICVMPYEVKYHQDEFGNYEYNEMIIANTGFVTPQGEPSKTITIDFSSGYGQVPVKVLAYGNYDRQELIKFRTPEIKNFTDYSPHTHLYAYIPFADEIELDRNIYESNKEYSVYYLVNFSTGQSSYFIYDKEKQKCLDRGQAHIGVRITPNANDTSDLERLKVSSAVSLSVGAVETIGGIATGHPFITMRGISNVMQGVNDVMNIVTYTPNVKNGVIDTNCYVSQPRDLKLFAYKDKPLNYLDNNGDITDTYKKRYGLPYNQFNTINALLNTGKTYFSIDNINIEFYNSSDEEELISILNNGVDM